MVIEILALHNWGELQDKYNYPVDILGRPIDPKDMNFFYVYQANGIDSFMRKDYAEKHVNNIGILENLLSPKR